ncbi:MAG: nitroreductase family protein, partial [Emcibacteraceae bacterium]|nr:nitroreductase family protein [Emcibacteraceae bacterium]
MTGPGPTIKEIDDILTIASRVPDHKKQVPWRYIIFKDDARQKFGEKLRSIFQKNNPNTDDDLLNFEANRLTRAPLVIAVISKANPDNPKVPEWEQILTAGAVCQNILLSASALGY